MEVFGVAGVGGAPHPDADAEEHDDAADCAAKAGCVGANGPSACHFQNLVAAFVADIKFERIGHIRKSKGVAARVTSASILGIAIFDVRGRSFGITIVNLIDAHGRQHKVKRGPKQAKEHQNIERCFLAEHVTKATAKRAATSFD